MKTKLSRILGVFASVICLLDCTSALAAPIIVPTLDDNTPGATRKLRGGQIDYSVLISNTGDANATSVTLTNPTPAKTTDIAGSLRVTPIAVDDAYTDIVANTQRTVSAAAGLLVNDFDPDGAAGSVIVKGGSVLRVGGTATGGVLVAGADGSFTYTPGIGQVGTERFQYTITDSNALDSVTPGFVDFTINAPRVWYVQNATSNGDGRSHSPFNSLASASAAANAASDIIYVFADIGANPKLNGNVVLENGQQLLGQGVTLVVNTLTNTAGDVVTLASGNTVRGVLIGNHPNGSGILGASAHILARVRNVNGATTRWSNLREATFNVASALAALKLTEIHYKPLVAAPFEDADEFKFLEFKNTGATVLNLGNCALDGVDFVFPRGTERTAVAARPRRAGPLAREHQSGGQSRRPGAAVHAGHRHQ